MIIAVVIQSVAILVLVGVTIYYAVQTRKMAEEMREQRYDSVRPVIDIEHIADKLIGDELLEEGFGATRDDYSKGLHCKLRNIGVGPAIDVYSFITHVYNERQPWDFGTLAIKEETQKKAILYRAKRRPQGLSSVLQRCTW